MTSTPISTILQVSPCFASLKKIPKSLPLINRSSTVDCIFLYGNNKSNIFHGCQPWLQSLPPVDDCTVGYMFRSNGMMFSNTNETEPTNIQFMFNANLPLNVFIKDGVFVYSHYVTLKWARRPLPSPPPTTYFPVLLLRSFIFFLSC
ncbi:hypothetical protein BC936DRAFT_138326, partial [Jimgerdemannia flammicorona]